MQASIVPFVENVFHHGISSSVPSSLSSPLRDEVDGNQPVLSECHNSLGQIKYNFRGIPKFRDCFVAYPCLLKWSCPPQDHYMWSNSNPGQPPSFIRPNSPSFSNGVCTAYPPSQLHGLPRIQSNMWNSVVSLGNHHVGSALAVNPSIWDQRNAYRGESPDASGFHQGSCSPMNYMEFVSHNVFPHINGNCVGLPIPSRNVGVHTDHQRHMLYCNGAQMNCLTSSFEPPNECLRSR
ncbi:hypothetical protein Nepgr_029228 [Nepenthes gracilis]|uniref:Uncharacterized protein n=1 Tax=Nepenthes gracilis TaxID=150966 RepID=A0AAD3TD78_NEPGR|nr:hypothetical protein Nepgr_029228 [Nepenthes gracilis]